MILGRKVWRLFWRSLLILLFLYCDRLAAERELQADPPNSYSI
ncbi:hypothetical protein PN464_16450 [Nodularia sphaerocarpa CS-585]|nr:hypothetical protein [Nodularia sphaerocarpa]MDB9374967.1 hypothetical protein [Nodularia sphaerocarpa CS-585]MDB9380583.1 hypothetical protein [Nodularia sphaerocarpa CS-585A2]